MKGGTLWEREKPAKGFWLPWLSLSTPYMPTSGMGEGIPGGAAAPSLGVWGPHLWRVARRKVVSEKEMAWKLERR